MLYASPAASTPGRTTQAGDRDGKQVLTAYGPKQLYGKTVVGVLRSTFVLSADGVVERASYAAKAKGRVATLRRDLGID